MTEIFKRHVPYAEFSPVDCYIAFEELKKDLLLAIKPLVSSITDITVELDHENKLIVGGVVISEDFRYCSDFTSSVYTDYLLFNDNGKATFVDFGARTLEDNDHVYEVFRILRKDMRIKEILYRSEERKGCPLVSPLAKPHEYEEVMQIIEREGITE